MWGTDAGDLVWIGSNIWVSFWFSCELAVWSYTDHLGPPKLGFLLFFCVKGRIFAGIKLWSWLSEGLLPLNLTTSGNQVVNSRVRMETLAKKYSYLKVVLVAFEKCNPVYLILLLKGHSTYCPNIIIKFFHLGLGQQFIKPHLCPCRYVSALWKTQRRYLTQWPQAKWIPQMELNMYFHFP